MTADVPAARSDRDLLAATRPFMQDAPARSWWNLVSTFVVMGAFAAGAALLSAWPLRVLASLGLALTMVRAFILFHDLHHNAIFRNAPIARAILNAYGLVLLTPPRIWRETHNYHHAHTARTDGEQRGTFTLYTTQQWREAPPGKRLQYRVERHPLTIVLGYVAVFLLSFCLLPFLRSPRRYRDSGLALLVHGGVGATIWAFAGPATFVYAFLLPFVIAGATGAYLFYVQHNFEGITIRDTADWRSSAAALEASSYLELGLVMRWFTGNIGYHHVHHLNPRIPHYRLPEAMAAIPELQNPVVVKLDWRTLRASFRLKLWDPASGRMVGFAEAETARATSGA